MTTIIEPEDVRDWSPQVFAVWVAGQLEAARCNPDDAAGIIGVTRDTALRYATTPPRTMLGFVQYQVYMNGKTWPRAWALTTWLWVAGWYYRRKRH